MKIVVIEDSPTQAERLRLLLEAEGYQVVVASDGVKGLEACREDPPPDGVISDVMMPEMDGFELTRRLKAEAALADVPVMLLTSLDRPDAVVQAVAAGADNFISKPYEDGKLLFRLKRMIERTRPTPTGIVLHASEGPIVINADPGRLVALLHSALDDAAERYAQLERQRKELARSNDQRLELMRVVAHELRTPLSALSMRAELELLRNEAQADPKSLASVVGRNVRRMVRIIDDLFDLTNIDLGTLTTVPVPIDLAQVIESVVGETRTGMPTHTFQLRSPKSVTVLADPQRIEQVISNLLSNAAKYSPSGTLVDVVLTSNGSVARLEVADQGLGLSAEEQARVFDRYYRSDAGKSAAEGAGLGLHICKHLVELHHGTIGVRSAIGQGSTFWLELPLA